ncbi:MAG: hypothetical protein ABIJ83_02215 [Patescibacteria group bacterium]|nr:pilin [Patescibacteria group bacterium]
MFKKILKYGKKVFLVGFFLFFAMTIMAPCVLADDHGLKTTAETGYGKDKYETSVSGVIGKVVGAVLAFVGAIFLILVIYGGFTWMLARGNEAEVTKAKDLITSAIVGLIIVLAAYAITKYVGGIVGQ